MTNPIRVNPGPIHHVRRFAGRALFRTPWGPVTGRAALNLVFILVGAILMALSVDIFLDPNDVVPHVRRNF